MRTELFTAVVGDILDEMGLHNQFLDPKIQAMRTDVVMVGRAMPVLEADTDSPLISAELKNKDFGLMFEALDALKTDDVYICTGSSPTYALWGEMMSTRALFLNAAGVVLDGYHRDSNGILESGFPCFSYGAYAQDQGPRGKVVDYNCKIKMNGVSIFPGDIVFGGRDGVVIIPQAVADIAIRKAYEKAHKENLLKDAIEKGMSAVEAYEKFGIM